MASEIVANLRILLADDDGITLYGLSRMVISLGHEVVAMAVNGEEVVQLALLHQPQLILMDVKMPEMDGIEATGVIMAHSPIPIIIVSAYSDEATFQRAKQAGAAGYLIKPVYQEELNPAIQSAYQRFNAGNQD